MSESHLESDNRRTPQQDNGKEPRDWICEDELTSYIKKNSNVDRQRRPSAVSIFTVPNFLKKLNRDAYVPEIVSLGPYHHRSAELPPMNNHKGKALRRMMARFNYPNNMDFYDCARKEIVKLEKEIRDSYEENIDCTGKTLSLMLCLDGCFILEILRTLGGEELRRPQESEYYYEPLFEQLRIDYTGFDILSDILKLENQIPLLVLHKLLQLELHSTADVVDSTADRKLLEVLVKGTFKIYPFKYSYMEDCSWTETYKKDQHLTETYQHLLGLLHTLIVSPPPCPNNVPLPVESINALWLPCHPNSQDKTPLIREPIRNDGNKFIKPLWGWLHNLIVSADGENTREDIICNHRAVELRNAGIKFRPNDGGGIRGIPRAVELRNAGIKFRPNDGGGIRGIKFDQHGATIYLPPINVDDFTEILFRNLIALEMCKAEPREINYVTHYTDLMDQLIDSEQDVAVLRKEGIVTDGIGSDEEVAKIFNGLCKGVAVDVDVFDNLQKNVNAHYRNKFKVQIADLVEKHFSSPWKILALNVATVILLLTVVQTIFSVIGAHK